MINIYNKLPLTRLLKTNCDNNAFFLVSFIILYFTNNELLLLGLKFKWRLNIKYREDL